MSESPEPGTTNPPERVIVVDPSGVVYSDADRGAMENRARSAQQAERLRTGVLTAGEVAREADYEQPVAVNPVPNSIVPFRFLGDVRPETLNANFAHLGNLVAELQAAHRTLVRALDSLTDRTDRLTVVMTPPSYVPAEGGGEVKVDPLAATIRHDSEPPPEEVGPKSHSRRHQKHGFAEK